MLLAHAQEGLILHRDVDTHIYKPAIFLALSPAKDFMAASTAADSISNAVVASAFASLFVKEQGEVPLCSIWSYNLG